MRTRLSPVSILVTGALLLAIAFLVLWIVPSGSYLLLPDKAHPVAPLVTVRGAKPQPASGGIYFVDVIERKATLFERLFPGIRKGSSLVPAADVRAPGVSEKAQRQSDLAEMARSQEIAAAVALRTLGYKVTATPVGALVAGVGPGTPAEGKLAPSDLIVSVDGQPVRTIADAQRLIRRHRPGDVVRIGVRAASGVRQVAIETVPLTGHPSLPMIGVVLTQAARIHLPFPVKIDTGDIGGPSAGLAFALELMEKLGRDVDRGYKIAATGEIELDGSVDQIGGVKQKTYGAREAHVDVFLVPAGENARDARRYAGNLRIVPVHSFRQALSALATLPPKR